MRTILSILIATVLIATGPIAYAEEQAPILLGDDQIALIRKNCVAAQSTLNRLHSTDALARVNLGPQFEVLSTKLMAPMNSRVAINKLDGVELVKTTVEFNTRLTAFRDAYQVYEQDVSRAMQLKCTDQPVLFYETIDLAKTRRAEVYKQIKTLNDLVRQYKAQVDTLRTKTLEQKMSKAGGV